MSKKKSILVIALLLIVVMLTGGIFAYFTSKPAALTNTFTIGNVTITLTEPAWTSAIVSGQTAPAAAQNMTPGDNVAKDPTITNTGANNAYVFMKVEMPYYNSEDLFTMNTIDTTKWNKVSDSVSGTVHTYVYAYATGSTVATLTALAPTETATLFTSVTLDDTNATVEAAAAAASLNVVVSGYAIQTNLGTGFASQEAVYNQIVSNN